MAVRTNATDVQAALLDLYNTDNAPSLTIFITTASLLTDWVETCDAGRDDELSDAALENIEMLLAAHFYLMADQASKSEKTADASATFQGTTGTGLQYSAYGQAAMIADTSGCLARRNKEAEEGGKRKAVVTWVGDEYLNDGTHGGNT